MNSVTVQTFREAFCARFGCPAEAYENHVFVRCLPPHSRLLAGFLRHLTPEYFQGDFELIRQLAEVRNPEELNGEVRNHFYQRRADKGFFRGALRVRLSRRRLRRLGVETFE